MAKRTARGVNKFNFASFLPPSKINLEKDLSHSFEMTWIVIASGTRGIFLPDFHSLQACVKLMKHFAMTPILLPEASAPIFGGGFAAPEGYV
jgi:hypothetical protein